MIDEKERRDDYEREGGGGRGEGSKEKCMRHRELYENKSYE